MNEITYRWLGANRVSESVNRVAVPGAVFDAGGLTPGESVHWYVTPDERLLVTATSLSDGKQFRRLGSRRVGTAADGHRCTIPAQLFEPVVEGEPAASPPLEHGMRLHFVGRTDASGRVSVLTDDQLGRLISTTHHLSGFVPR